LTGGNDPLPQGKRDYREIKMEAVKKQHLNGETLGPHLERKRREAGLSLKELSEKTRIGLHYLEKIENGEFGKLPCLPYSRGFVRTYATYIGIDADKAVKQFNTEAGL
jgi:cytoskeletal protein RodZ